MEHWRDQVFSFWSFFTKEGVRLQSLDCLFSKRNLLGTNFAKNWGHRTGTTRRDIFFPRGAAHSGEWFQVPEGNQCTCFLRRSFPFSETGLQTHFLFLLKCVVGSRLHSTLARGILFSCVLLVQVRARAFLFHHRLHCAALVEFCHFSAP